MCSLEGYTYSVHQEWSEEKTTPRVCVLEHKRYDRCHINHFPQTHSPQKFTESWRPSLIFRTNNFIPCSSPGRAGTFAPVLDWQ